MKINLVFVPPGGGEADYSLMMEMPQLPNVGDYISIQRDEQVGSEDFIVRRIRWGLQFDGKTENGTTKAVDVECEFALGPFPSEGHRKNCERYQVKTGKLLEFDASGY